MRPAIGVIMYQCGKRVVVDRCFHEMVFVGFMHELSSHQNLAQYLYQVRMCSLCSTFSCCWCGKRNDCCTSFLLCEVVYTISRLITPAGDCRCIIE